jgi:uncharacterized protein with FMN-binding domain
MDRPHPVAPNSAQNAAQATAQTNAPMTAQASLSGSYHDGSFTGPAVYQYYGYVQTRVNVSNGRIASIDILQYPQDYSTSVYINTQALPMLEAEVVQAQNTQISGISGATLTSEAFVMSTRAALQKATGATG